MLMTPAERAVAIKTALMTAEYEKAKDLMFDAQIPSEDYSNKVIDLLANALVQVDKLMGCKEGTTWTESMKKIAELLEKDGADVTVEESPSIIVPE